MIDAFKRASAAPHHRGAALLRLRAARTARCSRACRSRPSSWPTCSPRPARNRVLALDLHAGQIQGFFNIPVDHLFAAPVGDHRLPRQEGPARPGRRLARRRRRGARPGASPSGSTRAWPSSTSGATAPTSAVFMHLIGDVKGKDAVIVDDMIDTAGTLVQAVDALQREGARRILACARARRAVRARHRAHQGVRPRGSHHHQLDPADARASSCRKIRVLSVAPLLGGGDPSHPRRGIGVDPLRVGPPTKEQRVMDMRELTIRKPRGHRQGAGQAAAPRRARSRPSSTAARAPVSVAVTPQGRAPAHPRPRGQHPAVPA